MGILDRIALDHREVRSRPGAAYDLIPLGFETEMRKAAEWGRSVGRDRYFTSGEFDPETAEFRIRRLIADIERRTRGFNAGERELLTAVCLNAVIEQTCVFLKRSRHRLTRVRGIPYLGAMLQRHLMLAFLEIGHPVSQWVAEQGESVLERTESWAEVCRGAMALVVVYDLVTRAFPASSVLLPSVEEDAFLGIDLLADLWGIETGLCLSVTTRGARHGGVATEMIYSRPARHAEQRNGAEWKVWQGARAFNDRYGVRWTPALLRLGLDKQLDDRSVEQFRQDVTPETARATAG
jgi:hypothetical protein